MKLDINNKSMMTKKKSHSEFVGIAVTNVRRRRRLIIPIEKIISASRRSHTEAKCLRRPLPHNSGSMLLSETSRPR